MIHGGMTFRSQAGYLNFLKNREISLETRVKWTNEYMDKKLGKDFELIRPRMPKGDDAKYVEWKINFERYLAILGKNIILIGWSLGGIFLAKYLSENKLRHKAIATYLICPPYDHTLSDEDLVGGFKLGTDLSLIEKNTKNLYLMFSEDDEVVPVAHADKYRKKLKSADFIIYGSKNGHFKISEFPEIVKMIKADVGGLK